MKTEVKKYLSELGKRGGSAKSAAKKTASRKNGRLGGRPAQYTYRIGWIEVDLTEAQAAAWNSGDITPAQLRRIRVSVPTSGADRSYLRDGEVVTRPGLPMSEETTLAALADDLVGEEAVRTK